MIFALCSIAAATGFATAFEAGRVLERRILGVQKLGSIQFNQDGWSKQNTIVMLAILTLIMALEVFLLPRTMNPFVGTESLSKRSMILSSWSGILALGYGGLMAWFRSLRNERKLFHLAKMEYERNRQQKEDEQTMEASKHIKRAAAAGAAAVVLKRRYEGGLKEIEKQKEGIVSLECDRGMYTNPSTSLAENERAWSEQLYQAMDVEAFGVAEKAINKRWKELEEWREQIDDMRMRNKEQEEKIKSFRDSRQERLKDQFDHFEGERERLVRLTQELEALKMDVEEYKEEARIKEEERLDAIHAQEEALEQRNIDMQTREKDAFKNLHQPITFLVSPPEDMEFDEYDDQTSPTHESMDNEELLENKNCVETDNHDEGRENEEILEHERCAKIDSDNKGQKERIGETSEGRSETNQHPEGYEECHEDEIMPTPTDDVSEKSDIGENMSTLGGSEDIALSEDEQEDDLTQRKSASIDDVDQHEADEMMDSLHSRSENLVEEEDNDIASVDNPDEADQKDEQDVVEQETFNEEEVEQNDELDAVKQQEIEDDEGLPSVDDLVEIFKTGSTSSHKRTAQEVSPDSGRDSSTSSSSSILSDEHSSDASGEKQRDGSQIDSTAVKASVVTEKSMVVDRETAAKKDRNDPVPFVGDVAETIHQSAQAVESIVSSALASLSLNFESSIVAESLQDLLVENGFAARYDPPLKVIPEETEVISEETEDSYSSIKQKIMEEMETEEATCDYSTQDETSRESRGHASAPNQEGQTSFSEKSVTTADLAGEEGPQIMTKTTTGEPSMLVEQASTPLSKHLAKDDNRPSATSRSSLLEDSTSGSSCNGDGGSSSTCSDNDDIDSFEDARYDEATDHDRNNSSSPSPDKSLVFSFASASTDAGFEDAKDEDSSSTKSPSLRRKRKNNNTSTTNKTSFLMDEEMVEVVVTRIESI